MATDRALYRIFCGKARTSWSRSSYQSKVTEGSPCRTCALVVTDSCLKTTFGGSLLDAGRTHAIVGVRLAAASTSGRLRTDSWRQNRREAKVFRTHAAPQGMCDNLIKALKLLTNQQKQPSQDGGYRACKKEVGSEQWKGQKFYHG